MALKPSSVPSRPRPPERPDPDPHCDPIALAAVDVIVERGYAKARIAEIVERAVVTRAEFDRRFTGIEDCARRTFDAFSDDFEWRVGTAFDSHDEWRAALRAAAYATADWMIECPNLVRFGMLEVLQMKSEMARVRREEVFIFCAKLIDYGRSEAEHPEEIPDSAAMFAIGSIMHLLSHKVRRGDEMDPHEEVPEMMFVAVRPYLGEAVAKQELEMPPPPPR